MQPTPTRLEARASSRTLIARLKPLLARLAPHPTLSPTPPHTSPGPHDHPRAPAPAPGNHLAARLASHASATLELAAAPRPHPAYRGD